jgi:hypothetical protein
MAGVQAMAEVFPDDPATVKHVILLTDGGADPTGIPELVEKLYQDYGITFSTVGVGNDAAPFLKDLAAVGGGRYHFTNDPNSIPSIFTEEISLASRAYLVEEPFFPALANSSPILSGINDVPRLYGYVATSPKDLAQVILKSDKDDPILAQWQYGLGRSVAFTSDATGRWARDWLTWNHFAKFWVQTVRYTIGNTVTTSLQTNIELEGEQARLTLDARDVNGEFINGYEITVNIVLPDGETQTITLKQVAPGRYEGFFTPTDQGVYLIRFVGNSTTGAGSISQTSGWTLSYSPEYKRLDSDPDLLLRLATLSGGSLASSNPADVFLHNLNATRASRPIWQWLMLVAALLLPFDIASRRLIITKQDMLKLREWMLSRIRLRRRASPVVEQSPQMQALLKAKDRAAEIKKPATEIIFPEPVVKIKPETESKEKTTPPEPTTSTTSSLLARKNALRKKRDQP